VNRRYQPDLGDIKRRLPDMGESLHNAAVDLGKNLSLDRCDEMLDRLRGAEHSVRHLRRVLAETMDEERRQIETQN
jgi:hypothetical protein